MSNKNFPIALAAMMFAAMPAFAQLSAGSSTGVGVSLPGVSVNSSTNAGANTSTGATNNDNANVNANTQTSGADTNNMAPPAKPQKSDGMSNNAGLSGSSSSNANIKN